MSRPLVKQDGTNVFFELPGYGILFAAGTTVPSSAAGYATGCIFIDLDTAGNDSTAYLNEGTNVTSSFKAINTAA